MDMHNLFTAAPNQQINLSRNKTPEFDRLTPHDHTLCRVIGARISGLLADYARDNPQSHIIAPHPTICAMTVGLVHLRRPLRLQDFADADSFSLLAEYITIEKFIDRPNAKFPDDVILQFAQHRAV